MKVSAVALGLVISTSLVNALTGDLTHYVGGRGT